MKAPEHVILSRTDSIGDVVLTLPMAGLLKQRYPDVRITFLGRSYTKPVLSQCAHIDGVITLEELEKDPVMQLRAMEADALIHVFPSQVVASWAKSAGIPMRIGTSHRWWHWHTCTHRPSFSRKKSALHEAQLNVKLLAPLGISDIPSLAALGALTALSAPPPDATVQQLLRSDRINVILHPGSQGSAVEWGLARYAELIALLDPGRYHVLLTGSATEAEQYRKSLPVVTHVTDTGGLLSLDQLLMLIGASDALVAASTGPLHIAAALGKRAVGLYVNKRPIHPGRWAPLGADVHVLVPEGSDEAIASIPAERVVEVLSGLGN